LFNNFFDIYWIISLTEEGNFCQENQSAAAFKFWKEEEVRNRPTIRKGK
jgi:hypothetical protein